jgi:hypothetical protein
MDFVDDCGLPFVAGWLDRLRYELLVTTRRNSHDGQSSIGLLTIISASALSLLCPTDGLPIYPRAAFLNDLVEEATRDIGECLDAGAVCVQIHLRRRHSPSPGARGESCVRPGIRTVSQHGHALQQDADGLKAAAAASDAAKVTLDLTTRQLQAGYVNYPALLSAEQSYQQVLIALVQAQSNRYADTAALFQALGGGWWNRPDIPMK